MTTIENNLFQKCIWGGKLQYVSPLAEQISIGGRDIICTSGDNPNTIPGMNWGGQYNDEPTD